MTYCPTARSTQLAIFIIAILCGIACGPKKSARPDDKILASVDSRILYESDLKQIIHPNSNNQDSQALATAFIDQWIMDQLMTREAARHFSSDFEIEALVDDYREKLLKYNLEEKIIDMRFDTSISNAELEGFYDDMKEQFYLKDDIYRCIFARFERSENDLSEFVEAWEEGDDALILQFISDEAVDYEIDTTRWHDMNTLNAWYSAWSESKINSLDGQRQRDEEYEYFLKVTDKMDKGSISPLQYVKPQLISMLMHRRKQEILERYKQELYNSALNRNLIKYANSENR